MGRKINLLPLVDAIAQIVSIDDMVLLFGSAARDELGPKSDIDILIVSSVPHEELVAAISKVQNIVGRVVEATTYLPHEFQSALRRRDPFLHSVLAGPTVRLHGVAPSNQP